MKEPPLGIMSFFIGVFSQILLKLICFSDSFDSPMLSLKKDKKEEEEKDGGNPYTNLEKTSVLQEARYH